MSKIITEKLIAGIKDSVSLNQWKNTKDVITWFNNIENKSCYSFVQFDIVDFYPSISEELFNKSVDYAKNFTNISDDEMRLLRHCKKSFLFDENSTWVKKAGSQDFDVTMGSYDGAETCELVGLYILDKISPILSTSGLYRDDGLAVLKNANGHQADKIRKEIIKIFKCLGLNITIQVNLKTVNFLDVTFNLLDGTYQPYHKPNETPIYININSNHPPNIIKQIPNTINKRINELSSTKEVFEKSAPYYNDALSRSGYTQQLAYIPEETEPPKRKKRSRNIIWFNPPYSVSVKSNIARKFLNLIDRHFPRTHRFYKNFNRNNVKVSYSCMPNVANQIKSHNAKIINKTEPQVNRITCNCRKREECPLKGKCLTDSVVYRGKITNHQKPETNYIGMTEGPFKDREREHKNSLINPKKKKSSKLASYIWQEKDTGDNQSSIEWSIIERTPAYKNGDRQCRLCLAEKYHIIFQPFQKLNTRTEIISKCRHENKFYLSNFP